MGNRYEKFIATSSYHGKTENFIENPAVKFFMEHAIKSS